MAANLTIEGAYLIWAGVGNGANTSITLNGNTIQPDYINVLDANPSTFSFPWNYFSAVKDVTGLVQSTGNGIYQVSNFNLNPINNLYCSSQVFYSGWNIIVIYSNPNLPNKQLNIYDGFQFVGNPVLTSYNFTISNLNITNTNNAKLTYIMYNGSPNLYWNESVQINGNTLSNAQNPANNPFNGTNSFTGSNSSWNMDVDTYIIDNFIAVGNTSLQITLNSVINRNISTIITSIQSELPDATISLDSITGQDICQNRDLTLDYTVYNINSNDTLLAGTPISVFVNNTTLISTVLLPSNILMGDSLNLSTLVTIPTGISSPFTLSMVVNQNATQLGVYPESNFTNNTSNDSTISLTEIVYPNFGIVGPLCQGTSYTLPTTSLNNIVGTWAPATFNNQQTTTYTFTPNDTTCNQVVQLTVTIVPNSTPSFNIASNVCVNGNLVFPIATQNGAFGTWAPAFNNQATTTYTWTPTAPTPAVGCPTPAQHTVNIIPQTQPIFALEDSLCQGASYSLPLQASNGIAGTWAPAFNSQQSGTYNFTPNTYTVMSGCPASIAHNITIVGSLSPSFALPNSVCIGSTLNFPAVSNEGIAGSWSPAFNNQSTTSYTFMPNSFGISVSNQGVVCPISSNLTIGITAPTNPLFTLPDSICEGATVTLPLVSNNGVAGTWAPAFNNQATTTYTFTPGQYQCPITVQQTIVVSTLYDPTFSLPAAICQNEALVLPLVSDNGVAGSWSPTFSSVQSGSFTYVFVPNAAVCAYDYQYNLAVNPTHASYDTVTICQSQLPYVWYGQSLNGSTSTSTTFQNQFGCDSILNLHLIVNPSPVVDFSIPSWESCLPATINFSNNQVEANTIYNWSFGNGVTSSAASLLSNTYTQPGCYDVSLTAINQFGCATTNTLIDGVCIQENPIASFTVQNNPLPIIQTTTLLQNTSQNATSVVWDFGHDAQSSTVFSPIHTFPERAGSYLVTLVIQNANGCIDSTFEVIQIEQDPIYYVPNAFTPNGSELNNIFLPVFSPSLSLCSYQLQIFNRWGQTVFESLDPSKGWDGTIATPNGASMSQDGVYTYKISFSETGFEKVFEVCGSVSLVR
ncbi:PKD domain-containing protein [Flavobacterium sp.]|uniref:PKD domain-containing protein n=1 Tax=Flavobacterium sp. TaxID=239 RepID=UPI0025FCD1BF|nr:PKD domain-containing protein [Flavobacterium sp.]